MALSLVMVLCLLVYRLAERWLRERLAATGQTVPNHLKRPTTSPRSAGCSSASKAFAWSASCPRMARRSMLSSA